MRIIRFKINPQVKPLLAQTARNYAIDDVGFVEDVYALLSLKGAGIPTEDRLKLLVKEVSKQSGIDEMGLSFLAKKRRQIFKKMVNLPYFYALADMPSPVDSTNRMILNFRKMYLKVRQAQCVTCNLKANCDFGRQYGSITQDITKVLDPDFQQKVHKDCPELPKLSIFNQMADAIDAMQQMSAEEVEAERNVADQSGSDVSMNEMAEMQDELNQGVDPAEDADMEMFDDDPDVDDTFVIPSRVSSFSKNNIYDGKHNGMHIAKATEDFINKVTATQLAIFELGRKFSLALNSTKEGKFKPVPHVDKNRDSQHMETLSDITKLQSSQFGLPDEVFENKLEKKQLIKNQYQEPESKKQLLYLLIDNSGSMGTYLSSNSNSLLTRGVLASVFAMALSKRVRDDGGYVFYRYFAGMPGPLSAAKKKEDFDVLLQTIGLASFNGGGTCIESAVLAALKDIKASQDELAKSEILIITDADDMVNTNAIKNMLDGTEFNVLDVSGSKTTSRGAAALKSIATKYFKANETAVDINKMVELL